MKTTAVQLLGQNVRSSLPVVSPVQGQEQVHCESHLVLDKAVHELVLYKVFHLVEGVHHEDGDVEEDECRVSLEGGGRVLGAAGGRHSKCGLFARSKHKF